ncbi:MAG: hypothetical protein M3Y31_10670 [Gemmatimonadota bacterium]|nr:hypothetical protein [Gemmatimonadota bacterium]
MIDMMLAAGLMAAARTGDENRYAGTTMWSALPDAPVVPERAPRFRRLRAVMVAGVRGRSAAGRRRGSVRLAAQNVSD